MITVSLIAAQTRDGFIARTETEPSLSWTSREDKKRFTELTKRAGVVIMGRKTFATIGKGLPGRILVVCTRQPFLSDTPGVEYTAESPKKLLSSLEMRGFTEAALCGGAEIYALFLQEGVVDKLYLTIEPVDFGFGIPLLKDPTIIERDFTLLQETVAGNGTIFRDLVRKNS